MNKFAVIRLRTETHGMLKSEAAAHGYKEWALADKIISDYFAKSGFEKCSSSAQHVQVM